MDILPSNTLLWVIAQQLRSTIVVVLDPRYYPFPTIQNLTCIELNPSTTGATYLSVFPYTRAMAIIAVFIRTSLSDPMVPIYCGVTPSCDLTTHAMTYSNDNRRWRHFGLSSFWIVGTKLIKCGSHYTCTGSVFSPPFLTHPLTYLVTCFRI